MLKFIEQNKDGNYYICYSIKAPRGIRKKNESKADELLIIGIHKSKLKQYILEHIDDFIEEEKDE